jgi:hypothetical protein
MSNDQPVPPATKQPSFTPGPWILGGLGTIRAEVQPDGSGWNVCEAYGDDEMVLSGERDANARLIAAAPDLYAACQELLRLAVDPKSTGYVVRDASGNITKLRRDNDIIADARAALAKAVAQ